MLGNPGRIKVFNDLFPGFDIFPAVTPRTLHGTIRFNKNRKHLEPAQARRHIKELKAIMEPAAAPPRASVLDNICYAFHEMEHLTERPEELKQEIFKLLFNSAELANFTADERAKYQLDMTTERDIKNQIEFARDEGREEGRVAGRVEGIRLSALNMLKDNLPVDTICRYTGLSEEEVEALRS